MKKIGVYCKLHILALEKTLTVGKILNFLTTEWPLLFRKEGFLNHFNELVGLAKLSLSISKLGVRLISYFLSDPKVKPSKKGKTNILIEELNSNAKRKEGIFTWPILIFLILTYFEDDIDTLFIIVEVSISIL